MLLYPKRVRNPLIAHNVSKVRTLDYLFGDGSRFTAANAYLNYLQKIHPLKSVEFPSMSDVHAYSAVGPVHVLLRHHRIDLPGSVDSYYTPAFLNAIRCDFAPALKRSSVGVEAGQAEGVYVVAHIRTGDLVRSAGELSRRSSRMQNLESYFQVFDAIRKIYPQAHFFALSSTVNPHSKFDQQLIREFSDRGVEIRIDSELGDVESVTSSTLDTFSLMATADILIMAKSSFSHVAGFYNPNCVIYEEYTGGFNLFWENSLSHRWIALKNDSYQAENAFKLEEKLPHCLMQRKGRSFCQSEQL